MLIDVTEIGEDEGGYELNKEPNKEPNKKEREPGKTSRFDRKTLGVGLMVALLFVGGGIYAWQDSQLKGSIGQAVQMLDLHMGEEANDQDVQLVVGSVEEIELASSSPIRRSSGEVLRVKQTVEVITPNGGETFCLGDTFDISWRAEGVETVHVLLQSKDAVYNFGHVSAGGSIPQERITLPQKGDSYQIVVAAVNQIHIQDTSDAFFAIRDCTE